MKRTETIKDKKTFNNLIRHGKFIKNNYFIIYNEKNNDEYTNFGIAISNKVGKAVIRNKLKRQTRRIIDNNRNLFKNRHNYIIMIRKACLNASFNDLDSSFKKLIEEG